MAALALTPMVGESTAMKREMGSSMFTSRRNWLLGLLGVLVLVTLVTVGARAVLARAQPKLTGTDLGKEPAPDFQLRDASGQAYALDQFRGKVVILTFLYTHCTDVCPLTAEILRHVD